MVEGQTRKGLGHVHPAVDHRQNRRIEPLGHGGLQQGAEGGGQLGRLDHHPIARRQGVDRWPERQQQRIVPRRDHPDDAQGLMPDPGPRRLEHQVHRTPLVTHPPPQTGARMVQAADQGRDLQQPRLHRRPRPEIRIYGPRKGLAPLQHQGLQRLQPPAPHLGRRSPLRPRGRVLKPEPVRELSLGHPVPILRTNFSRIIKIIAR
jgi:hypothetical protein